MAMEIHRARGALRRPTGQRSSCGKPLLASADLERLASSYAEHGVLGVPPQCPLRRHEFAMLRIVRSLRAAPTQPTGRSAASGPEVGLYHPPLLSE